MFFDIELPNVIPATTLRSKTKSMNLNSDKFSKAFKVFKDN